MTNRIACTSKGMSYADFVRSEMSNCNCEANRETFKYMAKDYIKVLERSLELIEEREKAEGYIRERGLKESYDLYISEWPNRGANDEL